MGAGSTEMCRVFWSTSVNKILSCVCRGALLAGRASLLPRHVPSGTVAALQPSLGWAGM